LFSRVLGVSIDNIVVVDFEAFQAVVDDIGGVTVVLDAPFEESQQWAGTASESYVFSLPAGANILTGEQALYYVRSRYGSSDFDRARRQQQVMVAIKNKVSGLDLASDPIRALQLMTTVRKHIQTDLDILDLGTIKELLAQGDDLDKMRRYTLTTENLLYETKVNGIYELLPRDNTLDHIQAFMGTVLSASPVLPRPADPSPSAETMTVPPEAIPGSSSREPSPGATAASSSAQ
jgi:anionic cell wall polymer biosynthesis LytR-Cps2A-Psr (LCP) family protein